MSKKSAGILLYKFSQGVIFLFLVHPGGPFYTRKDLGVWSIPKGEFVEGEDALTAAKREFYEETGIQIAGNFLALSPVKTKSRKMIIAWAIEGELNPQNLKSNTFEMEWPPKSGQLQAFPEVDKGQWFTMADARLKIDQNQLALLDQLSNLLTL